MHGRGPVQGHQYTAAPAVASAEPTTHRSAPAAAPTAIARLARSPVTGATEPAAAAAAAAAPAPAVEAQGRPNDR